MQYSIYLLTVIANVALDNRGRVRPAWVERRLEGDPSAPKISRYKVRQMFKECADDGLLKLEGNTYHWQEGHPLNYLGIDVINRVQVAE